jgi:hypothetical protein
VGWTWSYLYWALGFKGATGANCYIYETIDDEQGGLELDGFGLHSLGLLLLCSSSLLCNSLISEIHVLQPDLVSTRSL